MNRKKKQGEEDHVLRFAVLTVIVLFVIGAVVVGIKMLNPRVDASEGRKKLEELNKADVEKIDEKIQELEKAEIQADEERQNRPNNEKFAGCLVLGDSITQGLYEYNVLDESLVIATKGVEVHRPDATGLTEILDKAVQAAPQKVFLAFGMNDVEADSGDADVFVRDYKEVLDRIRKELPDTVIFVNSILPANQYAVGKTPAYENIPAFNQALEELCREEGAIFIDNTDIVKEEYYEEDGVHMKADYYPVWTEHMVEVAEL